MPDNIMALDQHLPRFTGRETLENKVDQVAKYQYELLETLRYVLCHLDTRNFNMTSINSFIGTITDPFNARLEDAEGNLTTLEITAKGLLTRVSDAEGNISQLEQRADRITATVKDAQNNIAQLQITAQEINAQVQNNKGDIASLNIRADQISSQVQDNMGNISTLKQTAESIQSQVTNQAGELSTLRQTADSIQSQVTNQQGQISSVTQKADQISSVVYDPSTGLSALNQRADGFDQTVMGLEGDISNIHQDMKSITLSVLENGKGYSVLQLTGNGIRASSARIDFEGVVTFSDLSQENGKTIIHGGNILTGTVKLNTLYGNTIYLNDDYDNPACVFTLTGASSFDGQKVLMASGAIELSTYAGDIFLRAGSGGSLQIGDGEVQSAADLIPNRGDTYNCGTYQFPWSDIYTTNGEVSSSDRKGKTDIDYDMSRYSGVFDRLRPCSFRRINGTSGRRHHGLIAQDVEAALKEEGMDGMDFAGFVAWKDGCGLRYEELIGMMIYEIQMLKKQLRG